MADVKISDLSAAAAALATHLLEVEDPAGPASEKLTVAQLLALIVATANTFTAKQTFTGFLKLQRALEKVTRAASQPTSTQNYDLLTQAILYYTSNNANNWTLNVRGDGSNSLDSLMAVDEALTLTLIVTNGATPYYQTAMTIDGNAVTPQWMGAAAPSAGTASKRDTYTITIIKTASATFIVQASFAGGN